MTSKIHKVACPTLTDEEEEPELSFMPDKLNSVDKMKRKNFISFLQITFQLY